MSSQRLIRVAEILRLVRAALVACSLVGCRSDHVPAQVLEPTVFRVTGLFESPNIRESSGVAVSRVHPGVLWTHNDSGDDPILYAVDTTGSLLGVYPIAGASAEDWEDLALGRCPETQHDCLYIADTGDNSESRPFASVYIVEEPSTRPTLDTPRRSLQARGLRLYYADGPHDVEALAITPSGSLLLVSKGRSGSIGLYRIAATDVFRDSVVVERVQQLPLVPQRNFSRQVTGASISPSGSTMVVRTYIELAFYRLTDEERLVEATTCLIAGRELQGEAVDFLDDSTLVLTSEAAFGRPGSISKVRCPLN
jgi:hypothetical protein